MAKLLSERDHNEDPTLVQFAIQAWEVHLCSQVFDAFCYGAAPEVNEFLSQIFEGMHRSEPQPTSSRWRALAHSHARSAYLTTGPSIHDEATQLSTHLRGVQAILSLAGCSSPDGASRPALRARFGEALERISGSTTALARVLAEEVMSAKYEVVGVLRDDDGARSATDSGFAEEAPDAVVFCEHTMRDVFEGAAGAEHAKVVCVTELGLTFVRRRESLGEEYGCDAGRDEDEGLIEQTILLKPKVLLDNALSLF
jgi:hypothetical protein